MRYDYRQLFGFALNWCDSTPGNKWESHVRSPCTDKMPIICCDSVCLSYCPHERVDLSARWEESRVHLFLWVSVLGLPWVYLDGDFVVMLACDSTMIGEMTILMTEEDGSTV